jgi:hypothetical protein
MRSYLKNKLKVKKAVGMTPVVEHLSSVPAPFNPQINKELCFSHGAVVRFEVSMCMAVAI